MVNVIKRILTIVGFIFLVIFLFLFTTYNLMNSTTFQFFGGLTYHVQTKQKVVALTFDDGPTIQVDKILPILKKYNAKATFFLIGKEMEGNLEEAVKIVKAGHQIGNHSYSHKRMIFKSLSFIKEEIEKTDELIRAVGYKEEIDFRPPNGKKILGLPYYLSKHNKDTITWSLEPDTYYTTASDKVNYVKENVQPGSIILMHPMYDKTDEELEAIEGIVQSLSAEGYRFVTVNELQKFQMK